MALDLAAAAHILKDIFLDPQREQLNLSAPLVAEMERDRESVEGDKIVLALHTGRSEAVGMRAGTGGTLPAAQNQRGAKTSFLPKYAYGRIELSLPIIKAASSNRGSFVRGLEYETDGMVNEMKEDYDRQMATNDSLGRDTLAQTGTTTASTTVVLAATDETSALRLRVNQPIDIVDVDDDSVLASNRTVTAVNGPDSAITSIVISGAAVTTDSTHRVVRTGNWKNALIGIPGIVSDAGVLHGVDPATQPSWKATVLDNGGTPRAISEDLLQQGEDKAAVKASVTPDAIVANYVQRRKFVGSLLSSKRFANTTTLKGGFTTVTFNDNVPFLLDRFYPPKEVAMISRKHLKLFELADWDWADDDGAVLSRVSGIPSYEAFMYKFAELGTDRRNAHVRIIDLTT